MKSEKQELKLVVQRVQIEFKGGSIGCALDSHPFAKLLVQRVRPKLQHTCSFSPCQGSAGLCQGYIAEEMSILKCFLTIARVAIVARVYTTPPLENIKL